MNLIDGPPEVYRRKCPAVQLRKALYRFAKTVRAGLGGWVIVNEANRLQCVLDGECLNDWWCGIPIHVPGLEPGPYYLCPVEYMNEGYPERGVPIPPRALRGVVP